jgi:site-specific DNA-methyltransferase (adenine-specific)
VPDNVGGSTVADRVSPLGRWPANLIHDGSEEVVGMFPVVKAGVAVRHRSGGKTFGGENVKPPMDDLGYGDSGSAARFFYCAKASRNDRGEACSHPTVKPTNLMRYLCRLVTPPSGTVLDPFMGSGSTGKAALLQGFGFIGIELSAEYVEMARRRIEGTAPLFVERHLRGKGER